MRFPSLSRHASPVAVAASGLLLSLAAVGCQNQLAVPSISPVLAQASGVAHGGIQALTGVTIQLYAVGTTGDGSASTPLLTERVTTSDGTGDASNSNSNRGNASNKLPAGAFTITGLFQCPSAGTEVYLTATGGNPGLAPGVTNSAISLMAALGPCSGLSASTFVSLNELTTVGSVAALSPFMKSYAEIGSGAADRADLEAAFARVNQYTNTSLGTVPGPALQAGFYASELEIRTVADILAACVNSSGGVAGDTSICGRLFKLTTLPGGKAPADIIAALLNLLKSPTTNLASIYNFLQPFAPFQPSLSSAPASWTLPILPLSASSGTSSGSAPTSAPETFSQSLNESTVFVGASIVQYWPLPTHDAGVAGQTTAQVLGRFRADVLGHGYKRVVILVGTNDVTQNLTGFPVEAVQNIAEMATAARAAGLEVVLSELPPLTLNSTQNERIKSLNALLLAYARINGYLIVDFYTPMDGHPEYFQDGVHPNTQGYAVMEKALSAVVRQ
jgi:hypothetical protein